jgi:parallel beta-helix repeat protein
VNTINVRANRVTIDGLTVSGGRNGITGLGAANLTVRNCTVQSTGRTGIAYANSSSGLVDGCVVESNGRDGIAVDGAQATIINSTVTGNTRTGVLVVNGATARIGVTDRQTGAGNTITQNGATGITVSLSSAALIAMNTITENGTNANLGRQGIFVGQATASIVGGNTISNNPGQGVFAGNGAVVLLGDPSLGLPTVNTISGNGNGANPGGVIAFLGSTLVVRDAVIEQNHGAGLTFSTHSHGQVIGATIRNNVDVLNTAGFINGGDGIRLVLGSVLLPATPTTTISGNAGLGFTCLDGESSAVNTGMPFLSITGNARGDLPNCSAF